MNSAATTKGHFESGDSSPLESSRAHQSGWPAEDVLQGHQRPEHQNPTKVFAASNPTATNQVRSTSKARPSPHAAARSHATAPLGLQTISPGQRKSNGTEGKQSEPRFHRRKRLHSNTLSPRASDTGLLRWGQTCFSVFNRGAVGITEAWPDESRRNFGPTGQGACRLEVSVGSAIGSNDCPKDECPGTMNVRGQPLISSFLA